MLTHCNVLGRFELNMACLFTEVLFQCNADCGFNELSLKKNSVFLKENQQCSQRQEKRQRSVKNNVPVQYDIMDK